MAILVKGVGDRIVQDIWELKSLLSEIVRYLEHVEEHIGVLDQVADCPEIEAEEMDAAFNHLATLKAIEEHVVVLNEDDIEAAKQHLATLMAIEDHPQRSRG